MNLPNKLQTDIDFFFDPPHNPSEHTLNGRQSVLYHLRRELQLCLFPRDPIVDKPELKSKLELKAPCTRFTPILVVMSGIDLLGKFLAGEDSIKPGKVEKRFKKYLEDYFGLTANQRDVIWCVRNSFVHSFGLYDLKTHKNIGVYLGCLVYQIITPHTDKPFDFAVNVADLCVEFLESIKRYQEALRGNRNLQGEFAKVFPRYGFFGTT